MKMKISEIECPAPRESHTEASVLHRAADMKKRGLLHPPVVTKEKKLVAGMGRILSAKLLGWDEIEVKVIDGLSESDIRATTLCENLQRTDLSGWEKYASLSELMCMHPEWQLRDCAEEVSLDASMITRILSPSKCTDEWQKALKAGKVGISDCYAASKLPLPEQDDLLKMKLNGASRDHLEKVSKIKRSKMVDTVRVQRVNCPLPSGICVVVSGACVSLDESIAALTEAVKEMKRAKELGYTAKTFAAAMKDKVKRHQQSV